MKGWVAAAAGAAIHLAAVPALGAVTYCNDAAGRAAVLQDRKEMLVKLGEGKYAALEIFYGGLQKAYEARAKPESELAAWFSVFDNAGSRYTPFFEEWIAKYPDSYAAKLAYAHHLHAIAWAQRGSKFSSETTAGQFAAQKRELEHMVDVLNAADTLTRKPIVSQWMRISMATSLLGRASAVEAFQRAERIDPENSTAKSQFIFAMQPKWGGSLQELRGIQETLNASGIPADLKTFVNYHVAMALAEAARLAEDHPAAIKGFESAAQMCKAYYEPLEKLLTEYKETDDAASVVSAAERYLVLRPNNGWALVKLGAAQGRLKRPQESFRSYERAAQLGERTGVEGLAWHYARGEAVKRDPARALELYEVVLARGGNVKDHVERLKRELGK